MSENLSYLLLEFYRVARNGDLIDELEQLALEIEDELARSGKL